MLIKKNMMVNSKWVKKMDLEFLHGLIIDLIKVIGLILNNMEEVNILQKMKVK